MGQRLSLNNLLELKAKRDKIVCLTAYTAPIAKAVDAKADIILVGDSLGMVIYGLESTLAVTIDMMINHAKAVTRSTKKSFIVVDMPFSSYQISKEEAFRNAAHIIQNTGAQAVKIEGGSYMIDTIKFLVERGIAVVGHIGLQPQSINVLGGYQFIGKSEQQKLLEILKKDIIALQKVGAFALVIEATHREIVDNIIKDVEIITIGIGASKKCDGQILVTEDILGFNTKVPKFVKKYDELNKNIEIAISKFSEDVRNGNFPTLDHLYE